MPIMGRLADSSRLASARLPSPSAAEWWPESRIDVGRVCNSQAENSDSLKRCPSGRNLAVRPHAQSDCIKQKAKDLIERPWYVSASRAHSRQRRAMGARLESATASRPEKRAGNSFSFGGYSGALRRPGSGWAASKRRNHGRHGYRWCTARDLRRQWRRVSFKQVRLTDGVSLPSASAGRVASTSAIVGVTSEVKHIS